MEIIGPLIKTSLAGISTMLGCLFMFIKIKDKTIDKWITFFLSISLSIMIIISITELLPSSFIILTHNYNVLGILLMLLFLLVAVILTTIISNLINKYDHTSSLYRVGLLSMFVLILHNIPEGIITFITNFNNSKIVLKITIAIAIHNIPEGICISMPIYYATNKKSRALLLTFIASLSEPFGAIITYLFLQPFINNIIIALILSLVSGIMISLSINKVLPECLSYNKPKYISFGIISGLVLSLLSLLF